jgi:hypothetical protein
MTVRPPYGTPYEQMTEDEAYAAMADRRRMLLMRQEQMSAEFEMAQRITAVKIAAALDKSSNLKVETPVEVRRSVRRKTRGNKRVRRG